MIDTHCHLNFEAYDADRAAVIQRALDAGVTRIINPATDLTTSQAALDLTDEYPGIYAAVGYHPNSALDFTGVDPIRELARHPKVVAIGEIGLDYYWDKSPREQQFIVFEAQLALAAEIELPVIIHNRDAGDDVLRILESWTAALPQSLRSRPGVLHSFSAPPEIADRALAIGFYLGFTGPITFKKADELRAIAREVPLDRIVVETDGPFLTPMPYRGKRNEPAYIPYIVDQLANLKQLPTAEMSRITTTNAERLFQLPESKRGTS
jgi:TatD DNase family protein